MRCPAIGRPRRMETGEGHDEHGGYDKEKQMKRIFALILAVGLMAALLALPAAATAKAEFAEYIGTSLQTDGPNFGPADWTKPVVKVDFQSVYHDESFLPDMATLYLPTTGETTVSGTIIIKESTEPFPGFFDLFGFLVPVNATMHGTSVTAVDNDSGEGTWVGRWQGKMINGVAYYKAVAHGTGDFAGMKMKMTFRGDQPYPVEGRILDPHGN